MSRLDELLQEKCPDGVEYKQLKDILTIKNGSDYKKYGEGNIPVYGSGGVMTHIDTFAYDKPSVLIPRKGSLDKLYYVDVPFWTVDTIFWTDIDVSKVEPKYVYYCLEKKHLEKLNKAGGVPSLTQEVLNRVEVPVPPLEVQSEIVRILDKFTQLKAELSAELSARRVQYEYYRNELLTFGDDVPLKSIGEICSVSAGGDAPKDAMSKEKEEGFEIPIVSNGIGDNALYGYTNIAKITEPAVTVAARGTIGYAEYRDYPYYPIIRLLTVMPKNNKEVHTKYLYYCLAGKEYSIPQGGIPQLTAPMLKKELIPIPSIDKQKEIIRILDRFNCLTTDIYSGIPAEIEARTKQYEFYRDKLLSFKRKEAS